MCFITVYVYIHAYIYIYIYIHTCDRCVCMPTCIHSACCLFSTVQRLVQKPRNEPRHRQKGSASPAASRVSLLHLLFLCRAPLEVACFADSHLWPRGHVRARQCRAYKQRFRISRRCRCSCVPSLAEHEALVWQFLPKQVYSSAREV